MIIHAMNFCSSGRINDDDNDDDDDELIPVITPAELFITLHGHRNTHTDIYIYIYICMMPAVLHVEIRDDNTMRT
jgi:hypothetical protein